MNKKAQDSHVWHIVGIIIALALLIFLVYLAIRSGTFAKLIGGKIL